MNETFHKQIDDLFCKGDFRAALACADEAIAQDPTDPMLYLKRADVRFICDETADIRDDVQQALNLDPNSSDAYAFLAAYWLVHFDLKQARNACEKALKLDPENYAALYHRGVCSSWNSEYTSSTRDFQEVLKLTENLQVPKREKLDRYYYRTASFFGLRCPQDSFEICTEAIRLFPNHIDFYIQRALDRFDEFSSPITQNDFNASESDLRTAESILKRNESRYSFLYYGWASFFCERNENVKALEMIDAALEIQPQCPDYLLTRGRLLLYYHQKPEEALECFNAVVQIVPNFYGGYLNRIPLLQAQMQHTAVQADVKKVLNLLPIYEDSLLDVVGVLNEAQQSGKARKICDKIIEKNAENAEAYFQRGLAWYSQGIYDLAYRDFDEAIRREQNIENPLWFSYRGSTANALGEKLLFPMKYFHQALKDYSKACELSPKTADCWSGRGHIWHNIARRSWFDKSGYSKAVDDFTESIRLNAENPETYVHRAYAYWQLRDYEQVIIDCTHAIRIDPENLAAYTLRMKAYNKTQNDQNALDDLQKVHALHDALLVQQEAKKSFCEKHENKNRLPF